jgi:hypothetical protein
MVLCGRCLAVFIALAGCGVKEERLPPIAMLKSGYPKPTRPYGLTLAPREGQEKTEPSMWAYRVSEDTMSPREMRDVMRCFGAADGEIE